LTNDNNIDKNSIKAQFTTRTIISKKNKDRVRERKRKRMRERERERENAE
jgi:hypothetical protein